VDTTSEEAMVVVMATIVDPEPHPRWGGREWGVLSDAEFRGRVAGQIDLLVQAQSATQVHLYRIEKALGVRDVRMGVIGICAGAVGGVIIGFVWLIFQLAVHGGG